jgi:hypothetical protein
MVLESLSISDSIPEVVSKWNCISSSNLMVY